MSYDRYHAEYQGIEPVLDIAQAAVELSFPLSINVTRAGEDPELANIAERFRGFPGVHLRFYDVQPVGRARLLPLPSLRSEVEGFCSACASPAITDDGRVIACNGPAYFAPPHSPLNVGSLREHSMTELLDRHRADPVLDTIRTFGPARLRDSCAASRSSNPFRSGLATSGSAILCQHVHLGRPRHRRPAREPGGGRPSGRPPGRLARDPIQPPRGDAELAPRERGGRGRRLPAGRPRRRRPLARWRRAPSRSRRSRLEAWAEYLGACASLVRCSRPSTRRSSRARPRGSSSSGCGRSGSAMDSPSLSGARRSADRGRAPGPGCRRRAAQGDGSDAA